jgi:hypothetical protein
MIDYGGEIELQDHVARYLLRVAVSNLPPGVVETLNGMSEEELKVLDQLGISLRQAQASASAYAAGVH